MASPKGTPAYPLQLGQFYSDEVGQFYSGVNMTHEELTIHVRVLEERLAKLAGAVIVLLQAIEEGTGNEAAGAIRVLLESDYEGDE